MTNVWKWSLLPTKILQAPATLSSQTDSSFSAGHLVKSFTGRPALFWTIVSL